MEKWGLFGVEMSAVITKNLVFINISAIFFGGFLAWVREKIIFV
jgi:hypothetical protein